MEPLIQDRDIDKKKNSIDAAGTQIPATKNTSPPLVDINVKNGGGMNDKMSIQEENIDDYIAKEDEHMKYKQNQEVADVYQIN